jgi:hypothetical protein
MAYIFQQEDICLYPRSKAVYPLYLRVRPNADTLAFIDGKPAGAFNPFHKKIRVDAALLNDCKYGHDVEGGRMRLTLLRSPVAPDETAGQGIIAESLKAPEPGAGGGKRAGPGLPGF